MKDKHFLLDLEIEKSNLEREKAMVIMDKSLFLYFTAIFVAVVGFVNKYLSIRALNALIILGIIVLVIGMTPYIRFVRKEEKKLAKAIKELK